MLRAALSEVEAHRVPFVLAVNRFDGARRFALDEVREALGLGADVPVLECDARARASVRDVLAALTDRVIGARPAPRRRMAAPVR